MTTDTQVAQLHIRGAEGQSHDVPVSELDIGDLSSDQQIKQAAADWLTEVQGTNVPVSKFANFRVARNETTGDITMNPDPTFG